MNTDTYHCYNKDQELDYIELYLNMFHYGFYKELKKLKNYYQLIKKKQILNHKYC